MTKDQNKQSQADMESFSQQAEQTQQGLLREFWAFLCHSKKWWLIPIIVVFFLVGLLIFLGSTPAAPFIYTLF